MPPKLDTVIFCDDFREETGNKGTLVGVYGKRLFLPKDAKFPAGMRSLCIYTRFTNVRGGETIRITVSHKGKVIFESPESTPMKAPPYEDDYSSYVFFLIPFTIEEVGAYEFSLYWGNESISFAEQTLTVLLAS